MLAEQMTQAPALAQLVRQVQLVILVLTLVLEQVPALPMGIVELDLPPEKYISMSP